MSLLLLCTILYTKRSSRKFWKESFYLEKGTLKYKPSLCPRHLTMTQNSTQILEKANQCGLRQSTLLFLLSDCSSAPHCVSLLTSCLLYFTPLNPVGATDRCMGTGLSAGAWTTYPRLYPRKIEASHFSSCDVYWLDIV